MASFLKNTGDIILDAVLTDEGRRRLAMGDGSFKITKFALGDDEINYSLWNSAESSGQEDVDILRTPIFEAYTNNASSMKSKLMTMAVNNILFMPVLKLSQINGGEDPYVNYYGTYQSILVPVYGGSSTDANPFTDSTSMITNRNASKITIHQGIDSDTYSDDTRTMTEEGYGQLVETEYNVMVDSRLLRIPESTGPLNVDDDYIATYSFTLNDGIVKNLETRVSTSNTNSPIKGSRGTKLSFKVLPDTSVLNNMGIFNKMGSRIENFLGSDPFMVIRTMVRVVGATTGYSLDIPVLLAKKI